MKQVLVVDDDAGIRTALEVGFRRRGWQVETAAGVREALLKFQQRQHPLVVTDIRMPDGDGFSVMRKVQEIAPGSAVILLTAFASVPDAVEAMKHGACDYLVKPVAFERLEQAAHRILQRFRTEGPQGTCEEAPIGHSPGWLRVLERARRAALTDADVLIEAESGAGKEVVARLIHGTSARRLRPLIAVNCAAFPEALLESELFGHVRGAFTGADNTRPGKFELANGGTLLLDEIGEMPPPLQPKLLRVLQEREVDRLGDTRTVKLDVRVIATTNRPLDRLVHDGAFRADLYYRLNVIPLSIPPLRERPEDIAALAKHFALRYGGARQPLLSSELLARLEGYPWPGNVRELANLVRRMVALAPGNEIGVEALEGSALVIEAGAAGRERLEPGLSLEQVERRLFEVTLQATAGNRSRAAEMLGVSLRTVRNKVRDYGLPPRRSYPHE